MNKSLYFFLAGYLKAQLIPQDESPEALNLPLVSREWRNGVQL